MDSSWDSLFKKFEFDLDSIYTDDITVYPERDLIFKVFEMPVQDIKLVLLGQDCYHNGVAHGLSFSSLKTIPPSLRNIFKEIQNEFPERGYKFTNGNLQEWFSREKIFLLNCSLTVEKGKPGSHMDIWQDFSDSVIKYIAKRNKNCAFLLLGTYAKNKSKFIISDNKIDTKRIINGVHPSPFSAYNGFFCSNIFKQVEKVIGRVNWQN